MVSKSSETANYWKVSSKKKKIPPGYPVVTLDLTFTISLKVSNVFLKGLHIFIPKLRTIGHDLDLLQNLILEGHNGVKFPKIWKILVLK